MTIGAGGPASRPVFAPGTNREEVVMVPRGGRPAPGSVARLALGREEGTGMIRVGCGIIFLTMAADTAHGRPGIHPVDVAGGTTGRQMRSRQSKAGRAVSEARRLPACGRVAKRTVKGERGLCVLRAHDSVVSPLMAG
jgi:hypothetical protein